MSDKRISVHSEFIFRHLLCKELLCLGDDSLPEIKLMTRREKLQRSAATVEDLSQQETQISNRESASEKWTSVRCSECAMRILYALLSPLLA